MQVLVLPSELLRRPALQLAGEVAPLPPIPLHSLAQLEVVADGRLQCPVRAHLRRLQFLPGNRRYTLSLCEQSLDAAAVIGRPVASGHGVGEDISAEGAAEAL